MCGDVRKVGLRSERKHKVVFLLSLLCRTANVELELFKLDDDLVFLGEFLDLRHEIERIANIDDENSVKKSDAEREQQVP